MRKLFLIAMIGLCFSFAGNAAFFSPLTVSTSTFALAGEPSPELVEQILRVLERDYGYNYDCLCQQKKNDELIIDKVPAGYRVTFSDGGTLIITIEDM